MAIRDDLRAAWKFLEQEPWSIPGTYERRLALTGSHALFALLIRPDEIVGVGLDLPASMGTVVSEDAAKGFILTKSWNRETGQMRLSLILSHQRYRDVFGVLASDVVERVAQTDTIENGCNALLQRLAHWKRFLASIGDDGLSIEEQTGLYGELFVLRYLLLAEVTDPANVITSWEGPFKANQDFRWLGSAIEVKSTIANDTSLVCIANERQLDEDGLAKLFMCQLAFNRTPNSGETLPQIVQSVTARLDEIVQDVFLDRLATGGYLPIHEQRYSVHGYQCRLSRIYEVGAGFPRIKQADLRTGVKEVSYFADVSNIVPLSDNVSALAKEMFPAAT